jgi:putative membrane protein
MLKIDPRPYDDALLQGGGVMSIVANASVGVVAALHGYFCVLEMFYWDHPVGRKAFRTTPEFSKASKVLAANQGLYNAFLSAGLLWGVLTGNTSFKYFFLGCVVVAGVYGGATVGKKIMYIQALPALIALALVYLQ